MKIAVVGMGYVGLSNAIALAQRNTVSVLEISSEKVNLLNERKSPIVDSLASKFLKKKSIDISATTNSEESYKGAKYILVCTPTNYNEKNNSFDTSSIKSVIRDISKTKFKGTIIIRSTIPIGFTNEIQKKYKNLNIAFFPEFLREGSALDDTLNPSRIVCGSRHPHAKRFLKILSDCSSNKDIPAVVTESNEAEAIKLFANTYLAMRVAFFNELDTFALSKSLNVKNIIDGISMDSRIGNHYNNPSFGYGGYCLPKDTKQLASNYEMIPQELIKATVISNKKRKSYLAKFLIDHPAKKIGVYKLAMKQGSDNWRESAVLEIIKKLKIAKKEILIYEPHFDKKTFMGIKVFNDLNEFKKNCDLIIANRVEDGLMDVANKVFTRDIFGNN
jgi:UDPglucose 6-dehydrogenase